MKLNQGKRSVREAQKKCHHAKVAAVIQQWQKTPVQAADRSDAQHNVQQKKCCGAEGADEQRLRRSRRVEPCSHSREHSYIQQYQGYQHDIVDFFLPVPTDRAVLNAHGSFSIGAVSTTDW